MEAGVYLEGAIYRSKAWEGLMHASKFGPSVYIRFLGKRRFGKKKKTKSGRKATRPLLNNGKITFPYLEALEIFSFSKTTYSRILDNLVGYGFLDQTYTGGLGPKDCNLFAFSERWREYGKPGFKWVEREKNDTSAKNSGFKIVQQGRMKKMESSKPELTLAVK